MILKHFFNKLFYLVILFFSISIYSQVIDSDGDGIADTVDLDDDNDGILDTAECTTSTNNMIEWRNNANNFPSAVQPLGIGFLTGNDSTQGTGITRTRETTNNYQIISQVNATTEAQAITQNEYVEYKINVGSSHLLINTIGYYSTSNNTTPYTFTLRISADNFTSSTLVHPARNYTSTGADFTIPTTSPLYLNPNTTYTFRVYFYNVTGGAGASLGHDDFKLFGFVECDTDNDGIPNRLDLDSDGDGCTDAVEGGGGFTSANLQTATGSLASQTPNKNLGNIVGTTLTTTGIPTIAGAGQSIGNSQNNLINGCAICGSEILTGGLFPTSGGNTNTLTGWTVGGTYTASGPWASPIGRINLSTNGLQFRRDASTITTLEQNLTQVSGNIVISLKDVYWVKTLPNDATGSFIFTISYGGVVYMTINSTIGNTPIVTASNGAIVNTNVLTSVTATGTAVGITSSNIDIKLTLPTGIPVSGALLLTFNAGSDATQVRDLGIRSMSVLSCVGGPCYKPAATIGGATLDTKIGITALNRGGADNSDNWPMTRKGGWLAMESKTKGFVVNKLAFSGGNPVGIIPANFVEGMTVYDTTNHCLKMYTSTDGGTTLGWYCISTQTCPD